MSLIGALLRLETLRFVQTVTSLIVCYFTADNGTALPDYDPDVDTVGTGWEEWDAGASIQSNRARGSSTSMFSIDSGQADIVVNSLINFANGKSCGIFARGELGPPIKAWMANQTADNLKLWELTQSGWVQRDIDTTGTLSPGTDYELEITVTGTSIIATGGGRSVSYTSSTLQSNTYCGIRPSDNGCQFDDFIVEVA